MNCENIRFNECTKDEAPENCEDCPFYKEVIEEHPDLKWREQ